MLSNNSPRPRLHLRTAVALTAAGAILGLSSLTVVHAEQDAHKKGNKVFTCAVGTACIEGNSTGDNNTYGVFGNGANGDGVHGITAATGASSGVAGIATASSGTAHGVYGRATSGIGVYGTSTSNFGIFGTSASSDAIYGTISNTNGAAVHGVSTAHGSDEGIAVLGVAAQGTAVLADASSTGEHNPVLQAFGENQGSFLFQASNLAKYATCEIDPSANLSCTGTIQGQTVLVRQRSSQGHHVLAYTPRASTPTIEDFGTARMSDGIANVQIPSDFASVTDHGWYYVFLTPDGDTRGLYVNMRTPTSFQVRENERGHSNVAFDYRIVAHPLGASSQRLPIAPRLPHLRLPAAVH